MKILIISNFYPPYYVGGYELACKDITEGLIRRGHRVSVLTSRYRFEGTGRTEEGVYRRLRLFVEEWSDRRYTLLQRAQAYVFDWPNYLATREVIHQVKPDLLYVWSITSLSPFSILLGMCRCGAPQVYHLMDWSLKGYTHPRSDPSYQDTRRFDNFIKQTMGKASFHLLRSAYFIAMSECVRQKYLEVGYPAERLELIYHGVSPEAVETEGEVSLGSKRMVYVGRLVEQKGVHYAIEALAKARAMLGEGQIHLDIIGGGAKGYVDVLKEKVKQLNLEGAVRFLGFFPREETLKEYARYTALVFPSTWEEPFGITILEAMAKGVPVITSSRGGPREIIIDGVNGLFFSPGDSDDLAAKIVMLWEDERLKRVIKENSKKLLKEKFNLECSIEKVETFLEKTNR